jgi:methylenetetrahydrofolate reductase (NADPH)
MDIVESMEPIKNDDELVRKFGIDYGIRQCRELMENGIKFLHFYTMNLERSVVEIIKGLEIIDT